MVRTGYERLWMEKNGSEWDGAHWVLEAVDGEKWQRVGWCALGMRGCGWGKWQRVG